MQHPLKCTEQAQASFRANQSDSQARSDFMGINFKGARGTENIV